MFASTEKNLLKLSQWRDFYEEKVFTVPSSYFCTVLFGMVFEVRACKNSTEKYLWQTNNTRYCQSADWFVRRYFWQPCNNWIIMLFVGVGGLECASFCYFANFGDDLKHFFSIFFCHFISRSGSRIGAPNSANRSVSRNRKSRITITAVAVITTPQRRTTVHMWRARTSPPPRPWATPRQRTSNRDRPCPPYPPHRTPAPPHIRALAILSRSMVSNYMVMVNLCRWSFGATTAPKNIIILIALGRAVWCALCGRNQLSVMEIYGTSEQLRQRQVATFASIVP